MTEEPKAKKGTRTLAPEEKRPAKGLILGTDMLRGMVDYVPLPEPSKRRKSLDQPWRIIITHSNPNRDALGLELYGDVVLGRAGGPKNESPDLDLSLYDAAERGVSRRHAMLRPTAGQLFLIDLGSTNGTQVNAVPQETGMARALKHNDTLSLGNLHLTIKIMRRAEATDSQKKGSPTKEQKPADKPEPK